MSDSGPYDKVDPAALLLAVVAVSVPSINGPGAWGPTSTVTALVIGAIVFCFTWPHRGKFENDWIVTALSLVYGLMASVAFAWPVQSFLVLLNSNHFKDLLATDRHGELHCSGSVRDTVIWIAEDCGQEIVIHHYDALGTWIGFALGGIVAAGFWRKLRKPKPTRV